MNDQLYKQKIENLISYLKNGAAFYTTIEYKSNSDMKYDLKRYMRIYSNDENKVYLDILCKVADEDLKNNHIFGFDIGSRRNAASYLTLIERVLYAYKNEGKKTAVNIAFNSESTRVRFSDSYERFLSNFYNAILYKDVLDDVLKDVKEKCKSDDKKRTTYINNKALCSTNDNIYIIVKESGLSLLDFAHRFYVDNLLHKNFLRPDVVCKDSKLASELMQRESTCLPELIDVINKINNNEIDVIDYYKLTKLNPLYLKNIAKDLGIATPNLSKFVYSNQNPHSEEYKVNLAMNGTLIISNEEVSEELKQKAKQIMVDLDIPLIPNYYNKMVRKLIKSK